MLVIEYIGNNTFERKNGKEAVMFRRILGSVREFKRPTVLTVLLMVGEAAIETSIPFITANLVNKLRSGAEMSDVITTGIALVLLAMLSLTCGGFAAVTSAKASAGFARNLRGEYSRRFRPTRLKISISFHHHRS